MPTNQGADSSPLPSGDAAPAARDDAPAAGDAAPVARDAALAAGDVAPAAGDVAPAAASSGPVQYYALASGPIAFFDGSSDSTAGKQYSIPLSAITFTGGSPSFSLGSFPSAVQGGMQKWLEYLVNVGAIFPGPVIQSSGSSGSNSNSGSGGSGA